MKRIPVIVVIALMASLSTILVHAQHLPDETILSIAWSPSGEWIVRGFASGQLELLRADDETVILQLNHPGIPIFALAWKSDETQLAVGLDNRIVLYAMPSGQALFDLEAGSPDNIAHVETGDTSEAIIWLDWQQDYLSSGSFGGFIRVWDMPGQTMKVDLHWSQAYAAALDIARHRLIAMRGLGIINVDLSDQTTGLLAEVMPGLGSSIDISPDGIRFATGTITGAVIVWNFHPNAYIYNESENNDSIRVKWHPDSRRLAVAGSAGVIRIFDTEADRVIFTRQFKGTLRAVDWSPDGKQLVFGGLLASGESLFEIIPAPDIDMYLNMPAAENPSPAGEGQG